MAKCKTRTNYEPDPIDEQDIEVNKEGKVVLVPAVDESWVEMVEWQLYETPPLRSCTQREKEKWRLHAEEIIKRCNWLLALPYHRFWSHVAYDPDLHTFLETYLSRGHLPSIEDSCNEDADIANYLRRLHSLFFHVFSRMSTWRESKSNHLSPMVFGQLLYSSFAFDIPKLFDLCLLYHGSEKRLLQEMVNNIFSQNVHYHEDLEAAVEPCIAVTFDMIQDQLGVLSSSDPKPLESDDRLEEDFLDLVLYSVNSLDAFFEIYPPAITVFHSQGYHHRLAEFYDVTLPAFRTKLLKFEDAFEDWVKKLDVVRLKLINHFRKIVATVYLQPILKDPLNKRNQCQEHVEHYIQDITSYLSTPIFLKDYNSYYPVSDDLDLFVDIKLSTEDLCSLDHLKKGMKELEEMVKEEWKRQMDSSKDKQQNLEAVLQQQQSNIEKSLKVVEKDEDESVNIPNGDMGAAACPVPTEPELVSLISYVQDVLPDMGDGFIEECLDYYAFSSEDVIDALIENNLPEHLALMDKSSKRKPKAQSELDKRVCIFDNDEFDIHRRRYVDTSKIHTEKSKDKNMDKKYGKKVLKEFGPVYELYSSVDAKGSIYTRRNPYLNILEDDDEYDDSYDTPDAVPDELCGRSETVPRVLAPHTEKVHKYKKQEESESEEEETNAAPKTNFRAFASDPAELREQRRNNQQNRRPPRNRDVVGNPRGQGQEKQTLINRNRKETNKSSRANHNRKQGAQWKRSKAMF